MGPELNQELFNQFAQPNLTHVEWEVEARRRASETIDALSREFNEKPIKCPVVDPTIVPKLYALSRLSMEEVSVPGFNALELVNFDATGGSVEAFAGPSFDDYDAGKDLKISTRALLFIPGQSFDSEDADIEIFGINVSASSTRTVEGISAGEQPSKSASLFVPTSSILVTKGEPVHGRTSVFAVRNKHFGTIQIYGVTIGQTENTLGGFAMSGGISRNLGATEITVDLPGGLNAKVSRLENGLFDQALDEFKKAVNAARFAKDFMSEDSQLSEEERQALRSLNHPKSIY